MKMAKKAERQPKRWVLPAIWKFCELDQTHDLNVDLHELMPITAPLKVQYSILQEQCKLIKSFKVSRAKKLL